MGTDTAIAWTDHTWNPWQGCHKTSAGCLNCYMYRDKARYGQVASVVVRSKPPTFNKPLTTEPGSLRHKWRDGCKIFTCSWSDFFIEEADPWRVEAWSIIRRRPGAVFQILTKRPERIREHLPPDWGQGYQNVWLGVTVEDQRRADEPIPQLLKVPAPVRFVSIEPMIGPVDLSRGWEPRKHETKLLRDIDEAHVERLNNRDVARLSWCICGGESGPNARPDDVEWYRSLRDQCQTAGVPFFMKQMSGRKPIPEDLQIQEFPR